MLKKPKAILFDLDDTLISFNGASEIAWKECCDDFVMHNKVDFTSAEMLEEMTRTREWYWGDSERHKIGRANMFKARCEVFKYALKKFGVSEEKIILEAAENYSRIQEQRWRLFDEVPEALEALRQIGISMAVITNGVSEVQNGKLSRFRICKYFSHVICESEAGYSKPDKEIFMLALDKLSHSPEETWMIGDNLVWDIFGAQRLGIFAVWNDYEKKGLPQKSEIIPDLSVNSMSEMTAWLISNTK